MPLKVTLSDDHTMVRQGIRSLLEREGIRVMSEAGDGLTSVADVKIHLPDIAIIDLSLPQLNGIDAARQMLLLQPRLGIVALTMYDDELHVVEALRAGIRGYVLKTQGADGLLTAIRSVSAG